MSRKRLPVREMREVLRLEAAGASDGKNAAATGCSRSTVPDKLDDIALDARLYPKTPLGT